MDVVIGAGLAGLVAARQLRAAGRDVVVLETRDAVGGRVRTRRLDGFLLDRGFQVLFPAYPAARRHLDLPALDLRAFPPAAVLVLEDGSRQRVGDPLRDPTTLLDTVRADRIPWVDKLRILRLVADVTLAAPGRLRPAHELLAGTDRSARSYLEALGFSRPTIDAFFAPFFGGIFLDASLGTSAALFRYYLRMLVAGPAAVPALGMQAIPDQLADGLDIRLGHHVEALEADRHGVLVRGPWGELRADAAVVAADPPETARLTGEDLPADAVGATYVHIAAPAGIDRERRILLDLGNGPIHNAVWMDQVAPGYAPGGRSLLLVTVLGADHDLAALEAAVRDRLAAWYPQHANDLELVHVDRIPFAQFAQPPGIADRLPGPQTASERVVIASEATRSSSIQGAMEAGEQAAAVLTGDLEALRRPRGA